MLRFKRLRITAVGRFVDTQTIEIDQLGNLVQVDGQNNNTGGSSGAAKSTIFNSIDYLLGLNDIPNSVLQSRLTKEPMLVEGEFDLDGKDLKISRGKNKFSIELDGEVTSGSAKLTEEKLDSILAMARNMFRPILHKRQKEGGFFLQMTPSKVHEFLMDCSGLSDMGSSLDKIDVKMKDQELRKTACDSKLRQLQGAVGATSEAIMALGNPPSKPMDRTAVIALQAKANASASHLQSMLEKHSQEAKSLELKRPSFQEREYDETKINELKKKLDKTYEDLRSLEREEKVRVEQVLLDIKELRDTFYNLNRTVDVASMLRQEATGVAMQIRSLRECICPTCDQIWADDKSKAKVDELTTKLVIYEDKISKGNQAKVELEQVKAKIAEKESYSKVMETDRMKFLSQTIEETAGEISHENLRKDQFKTATFYLNNQLLKDFSEHKKAMEQVHANKEEQARGQANLDRLALESLVNSIKSYDQARARYDEMLSSLRNQELATKDLMVKVEMDLMDINDKIKLCEEAKKAIKSYMSCSFDDSLVQIGDMATRIIRNIPNMANSTIQLEGIRETKEGKLKEEVNAVISVDGEIGVPIKSLSGGERSAVDLAIDLAVIDLIEQKTGKGIDLFILDEPFTGLDTVSIEMTVEMLKNSSINKRLILVDHNPEVKEMVESKITVIRDGATSRIEQ